MNWEVSNQGERWVSSQDSNHGFELNPVILTNEADFGRRCTSHVGDFSLLVTWVGK